MKIFSKRLLGSTKKWVIPGIGVLALVIFSSLILFEATKATVDITQNGEKLTVTTHSNTVGELLDELDVVVGEHDSLSHDMSATVVNKMAIYLKESKQIFVTIDGVEHEFHTTADKVGEFLRAENLIFTDRDNVSFHSEDAIEAGLQLTIAQAYEVTIIDGGEEKKVWTIGGSIADLLDENEITLDKTDKIKPALDKEHKEDAVVTITRVEKTKDTVEETIAFQVETKEDSSLAKGKEKLISEGQEGTLIKTFEITKENGEEISRELINEEVKKERKNRVVAIGTKQAPTPKPKLVTLANETKNVPSKQSSKAPSGKEFYMNATAYSADCSGCSGITATGINLKANRNMKVIAVDPSIIPLGSKVWVEGYGNAIAGDTGGSIKGNRIDVHVPTRADALRYGWKKVKVIIIQ